jgi:enoyl-CoA hydratase
MENVAAPVLVERAGSLGHIRLNRPKALNSLTLEMVRDIAAALDRFEHDPQIATILIDGAGERGLCAGGDIRALWAAGRAGDALPFTFWREEYVLNARIDACPKPYVAIMDGITMGGGVGVSAHGGHRIVTERTRLAMPETGIGFFPDVGGTWLLAQSPGEVGTYLGLTGAEIGAADAIHAGLADTFVPVDRLGDLVTALAALPVDASGEAVVARIGSFAEAAPEAPLAANRAEIDVAFAHDDATAILAALSGIGSAFAMATRQTLETKSPTSLKLTLRLLRLARDSAGLRDCLEREFAACHGVLAGQDFYEGVRAAVIDKDRKPRWSPATLEAVSDADIAAYLGAAAEPVFPPAAAA